MKTECKDCARTTCRVHPQYKASRKPRCSCKVCWEIWEKKQGEKSLNFKPETSGNVPMNATL